MTMESANQRLAIPLKFDLINLLVDCRLKPVLSGIPALHTEKCTKLSVSRACFYTTVCC